MPDKEASRALRSVHENASHARHTHKQFSEADKSHTYRTQEARRPGTGHQNSRPDEQPDLGAEQQRVTHAPVRPRTSSSSRPAWCSGRAPAPRPVLCRCVACLSYVVSTRVWLSTQGTVERCGETRESAPAAQRTLAPRSRSRCGRATRGSSARSWRPCAASIYFAA